MDKFNLFGEEFNQDTTTVQYDKNRNPVFIIKKDGDIEQEIETICRFYVNNGYPDYKKEEYNLFNEYLSVLGSKNILQGNTFIQSMSGCGVLWTYFPNWKNVRCGNSKSISELWVDGEKLKSLIRKTYRWQQNFGNGVFTVNRLRQNAKIYLCGQSVSNFRPTVAKFIYNLYGNKGSVWDMSCGYGGRLFGFFASTCKKYYGTEPDTKTYRGLLELKKDLLKIEQDKEVHLFNQGSETTVPIEDNSIDLCFTSPPYFDTEKYSEEETQSYIKYPTEDKWVNGFLHDTFVNCKRVLKPNGYLVINIANVPTAKDLEERTIEVAKQLGFELEETLYMILSSVSGKGEKKEPIFVFRKA